jgi:hypothetical protein
VVRIIAQSHFDVNEENVGGAIFVWLEHRKQDGFPVPDQRACLSK